MKKSIQAGTPANYWIDQLSNAKRREKNWLQSAKKVVDRYRDERDEKNTENKFNILWSNTEVLKSALFTRVGTPDVRRQFPKPGLDEKIAKTAAIVLENALVSCGARYDMGSEIEAAIEDMLLPGRGTCWIEFDIDENDYKTVNICYVGWEDYRHGSAKRWNDVPWVARRHFFSQDDLEASFPDYASEVSLTAIDADAKGSEAEEDDSAKRAEVWEIWDKGSKTRLYVSQGCQKILRSDDDPYKLMSFFPCRSLYGVTTTNSLIPVPEFSQYQDQAIELDRVNGRIQRLTEELKFCGVYDKMVQDSETLGQIGSLSDGEFLPFGGAQNLAERGGISAAIVIRPLEPIITTLTGLSMQRDKILENIYQITGLSDILRGQGQEYETAAAQEIKARAGNQRFNRKQRAVQDFVRDLMRMKAEIIAEHFDREQLEEMTGVALPPAAQRDQARALLTQGTQAQAAKGQVAQLAQSPQAQAVAQGNPELAGQVMQALPGMLPQDPLAGVPPEVIAQMKELAGSISWEDVAAILRSDDRRNYSINVETDITAFEDSETIKKQNLEFLTTIQNMMTEAVPAVQQNRALGPMVKEMILFATKSFKVGRALEDTIEKTMDDLMNTPPQAQQPPMDPATQLEMKKIQADVQTAQIRAQSSQQVAQIQQDKEERLAQLQIQKAQLELQIEHEKLGLKVSASVDERQNKAADAQLKQAENQLRLTKLAEQHQNPFGGLPNG